MDLINRLKQSIQDLNEYIQNLEEFAANRGVDSIECLIDFIPDEILFIIFEQGVGLDVTLVNKRFNSIFSSWITSKVKDMLINKVQGWDDYIVESGVISRSCLYKWLIFNPFIQDYVNYDAEKDHHTVKIEKDNVSYTFNFVDGLMYTKKFETTAKSDIGKLELLETSTNKQKYLNIRCKDGEDIILASLNVIAGSCYAIFMDYEITISDGESHLIIERTDDNISYIEVNGLYFAFPKQGHPMYNEIMKILMSENSPYPIEIMNRIPM